MQQFLFSYRLARLPSKRPNRRTHGQLLPSFGSHALCTFSTTTVTLPSIAPLTMSQSLRRFGVEPGQVLPTSYE